MGTAPVVIVAALALLAALGFALSSVLEQRAASRIPAEHNLRLGLLARLIRRPMWLAGVGCEGLADIIQAAALGMGALIVVQPLLVMGLLFALPINARWNRQQLGRQEWLGAVAVTGGLALFLTVGHPGHSHESPQAGHWILASVPILFVAVVCVRLAQRTDGPWRPAFLATAAGTMTGLSDALVKTTVARLDHGVLALFTTWRPYATIAVSVAVMVLAQSAFQSGPLAASLPALTAAEPIAAAILGMTLFGEGVASGAAAFVAESIGALVMLIGVIVLARSPIVCGERQTGYRASSDDGDLCERQGEDEALDEVVDGPAVVLGADVAVPPAVTPF